MLLLDLDRFKDVNDTLGHHVGDLLLTEVGPRLQQPLRDVDTVARLGGDEFAILLPGPTDLVSACRVAERLVDALKEPFSIEGLLLEVGVSIGVALYPEHGASAQELLQHADVAMYAAKRGPTSFVVYSARDDTNSVRQLTLDRAAAPRDRRRPDAAGVPAQGRRPQRPAGRGRGPGALAAIPSSVRSRPRNSFTAPSRPG